VVVGSVVVLVDVLGDVAVTAVVVDTVVAPSLDPLHAAAPRMHAIATNHDLTPASR
jgi:hypothetical protein